MSNVRLGRGMDALLPSNFSHASLTPEEKVKKVLIDNVVTNQKQPRRIFDESQLNELAQSIRSYGVLQPIIVIDLGDGRFEIVAGERRYRASIKAGLKEVPVLVRSHEELERLEIALTENVQRVDLNPIEQAMAIVALRDQFSVDIKILAKRLGKAETTVSNIIRLLDLPEEAKSALLHQKISEGHARAILALKDNKQKQLDLLSMIVQHGWTVREAESFAQKTNDKKLGETVKKSHQVLYKKYTDTISKTLGTSVKVKEMKQGGQVVIRYKSLAELEKITKKITS